MHYSSVLTTPIVKLYLYFQPNLKNTCWQSSFLTFLSVQLCFFLQERSCFGLKCPGHLKHIRWRWAPTSSQKCQFFVATITGENCVKVGTAVAGLAAFLACNTATVASTSTCDESRLIKLWCDEFRGNLDFPGRNIRVCSAMPLFWSLIGLILCVISFPANILCRCASTLPLIGSDPDICIQPYRAV